MALPYINPTLPFSNLTASVMSGLSNTPSSGGSATMMGLTGGIGNKTVSDVINNRNLNQSLDNRGNITSVPPTPPQTTQVAPGLYARQGETLAKELTQYNVPNTPPLTNPDGSDTEFGQLVKMGGGNPIQQKRMAQLLSEWQASQPQPPASVPPAPTLPPTMPTNVQNVARPVGGTATPTSVGGGTTGSNVTPALTQAGQATKGLQTGGIKGLLPSLETAQPAPSAQMTPTIPTRTTPETITPQTLQQLQGGLEAKTPPIVGGIRKALEDWNQFQKNVHIGSWGLPELGITEKIASMLPGQPMTRQGGSDILRGQGIPKFASPAEAAGVSLNSSKGQPVTFLGEQGQALKPGQDMAQKSLGTNITDTKGINKAIEQYKSGKGNVQDVAGNIASEVALPEINKQMFAAQQTGDMYTVSKLADLAIAVQQNIKFKNQINQIIQAVSMGFGTPNAPGVTEVRIPQVQSGIFQGLETPRTQAPTLPGQMTPDIAQYLSPRLQDVSPVQQNKPPIYPFMG